MRANIAKSVLGEHLHFALLAQDQALDTSAADTSLGGIYFDWQHVD